MGVGETARDQGHSGIERLVPNQRLRAISVFRGGLPGRGLANPSNPIRAAMAPTERRSLAAIRSLEAFLASNSLRRQSSASDQRWERRELVPDQFTASAQAILNEL